MDTNLPATLRTATGKSVNRKLRAAGQVPAVVYADGKTVAQIAVDPHALSEIFRKSQNRNTIVNLEIDGKVTPALVKEATRHPVSRLIEHVDFYALSADKPVVVNVPLLGVGKPAGAANGGRLQYIRRHVKARCAIDAIPSVFEIDITPLNVGEHIKASQIAAPAGVEVVFDHDFPVVSISGKKKRG